jgi:hypothetical protein
MAKSQKRSSREAKKPKAAKAAPALATSNLMAKGTLAQINSFKKKK